MPERSKPIRGLQDIRTISGKVDMVSEPYRAYMKITCLEMEKARRGKERESAMGRVKKIDARFEDIETEKTALLKTLEKSDKPNRATNRNNDGGFKIKY